MQIIFQERNSIPELHSRVFGTMVFLPNSAETSLQQGARPKYRDVPWWIDGREEKLWNTTGGFVTDSALHHILRKSRRHFTTPERAMKSKTRRLWLGLLADL